MGERRGHRCRGSAQGAAAAAGEHRDLPLSQSRQEGERPRGSHARPARTPAAAGHPRTAWTAGVYDRTPLAQAEPLSPAGEGSSAQHTEFLSAGGRCPKRPMGSRVAKSDGAASRLTPAIGLCSAGKQIPPTTNNEFPRRPSSLPFPFPGEGTRCATRRIATPG